MQNKYCCRFMMTLLLSWPFFTGCYSYLSRPGVPFHHAQESNYFEKLIDDASMTDLTYRLADTSELTVKRFDSQGENGKLEEAAAGEADRNEALAADLLLRFVWLSDVHITQREIKLGSELFSHAMDEVTSVTEFNKAQEDFHWAVYLSQVAAINALHRENPKEPVDFMINTGDSVTTGSLEELYQFIYISNKLSRTRVSAPVLESTKITSSGVPRNA
jgi:hypothetical protein